MLVPTGASVVVVGKHERKLSIARALGARTAHAGDPLEREHDVVVEATGTPEGLERALALVVPRGTVVLKSTFHGATTLDAARVVIDEVRIVGSRCGPFAPAIRALASGRVDPRPLVEATFSLGDAGKAMERARAPGALKVLLST